MLITNEKPNLSINTKKIDSYRIGKQAFYSTVEGQKLKVCKTYFKNTLDINDRPIRTVINKLNSSGIVETHLHGKHEKHNQVQRELLEEVHRHIKCIPWIGRHYLRQQTTR